MKRTLPLAVVLALTACGGSSGASATEWTSAVCKALTPLVSQSDQLQSSLSGKAAQVAKDPAGVKAEFDKALGTLAATLQDGIDAAKKAGPPDVDNGEQIQKDTLSGLQGAVDTLKAGQAKLKSVEATPEAVGKAFVDIGTEVSNGFEKFGATFDNLDKNKELSKAGDDNPDCKALNDA